ncbi:hypothetical protein KR51_00022670 [Rubidibacter lacunae KORDI 51-2]|uniref:Uncharacterized protein n=1 Tax=Rubidibacter lacunae KORDI 51-2 TaxID=582515 RepID=U5DHT0_9CHRO|nr:hypothetical protein KR51_00022670 [Rubidibacter lacunae KORDI 51-2]
MLDGRGRPNTVNKAILANEALVCALENAAAERSVTLAFGYTIC